MSSFFRVKNQFVFIEKAPDAIGQHGLDIARVLLDESGVPDEQIRTSVMVHP